MSAALFVTKLQNRSLIEVGGPDWRGFLQGLLSQDVETLGAGEIRFAALLNPQGKLLYDLFLIGGEDGCRIDVAGEFREALVARLALYRLRAKVEIRPITDEIWALWPQTDDTAGAGWLADPRLAALGWRGYGAAPAPASAEAASEALYEAHRIALGVPEAARDCPPETGYPIEANFDLLGGIDFKKGCFVGQETTSRMKRRGQIKNRMLPIAFDGPPLTPGAEVLAGELRAGEVCSGAEGRAIALLRLDRIKDAALTVDGRAVRVERPEYLAASSAS
jgi:folate-binding protein YgfZ